MQESNQSGIGQFCAKWLFRRIEQIVVFSPKTDVQRNKNFAFCSAKNCAQVLRIETLYNPDTKKNKVQCKLSLTGGIQTLDNVFYLSSILHFWHIFQSYLFIVLSLPTKCSFNGDKLVALQLIIKAILE